MARPRRRPTLPTAGLLALVGFAFAGPVQAVVTAGPAATDVVVTEPARPGQPAGVEGRPLRPWPDAPPVRLQGLARLDTGCSAVLLLGGRHLLGAAHCTTRAGGSAVLASGEAVQVRAVFHPPGWAGQAGVHDLALLELERPAATPGYAVADRASVDGAGRVLIAEYGASGSVAQGWPPGQPGWGLNEYDARIGFPGQGAQPEERRWIRVFDFDDGSLGANVLGLQPGGQSSLGQGALEAMLGSMDSGGPSFVAVAGSWRLAAVHVGIDARRGSGFGGLGLDLLVAPYVQWILSVTGSDPARAP